MLMITELSHIGLLSVFGEDAKSFLQGQVTCHVEEVSPIQSTLGAHCNLKGRMISLFRLFQMQGQNGYYLSMPLSMVPIALAHFKKYALFSKVSLEAVPTSSLSRFGVSGLQAEDFIHKISSPSSEITICRLPDLEPRYEIYGSPSAIKRILFEHQTHFHPLSNQAWELLDIQSGIPTVFPETSEKILPHHANLVFLQGISFKKGCYLGQEIIARMQFKGKIKKHLYRAYVEAALTLLQPGTPIFSDNKQETEEPGMVIRASRRESGYEFLYIQDEQHSKDRAHLGELEGPVITPLF